MIERIIVAGAGGQGIMLLGKILAEAAMRKNRYVTWLPSYGAEVRGGTAHCMVIISDQEIGSPYIDKADSLIVMNSPSLERFKARIKNNGLCLINSSLVKKKLVGKNILSYPFTDIAIKIGNPKVANVVALGCFITLNKAVDLKNVLQAIEDMAPAGREDLIADNKKALQAGMALIKEKK